jgi:DNA-binding MarR family transcriptional regulator
MVRNRTTVKVQPGLFLQPFVVAQLSGTLIEAVVEGSEVGASEYAVTSWLGVVGSATPTELARDLGLSPTTLSAMIDRLARKKQVRRVRHPEDGRSYLLELTPKGQATNARNAQRFEKALRAVRARLDGEPEEILEALRRLEDALRRTIADSAGA